MSTRCLATCSFRLTFGEQLFELFAHARAATDDARCRQRGVQLADGERNQTTRGTPECATADHGPATERADRAPERPWPAAAQPEGCSLPAKMSAMLRPVYADDGIQVDESIPRRSASSAPTVLLPELGRPISTSPDLRTASLPPRPLVHLETAIGDDQVTAALARFRSASAGFPGQLGQHQPPWTGDQPAAAPRPELVVGRCC